MTDVLVFERTDSGFSLIGGSGRGAGWAGIVDVDAAPDSLLGRAWRTGSLVRVSAPAPIQIAGPYYARVAIGVPVGHAHVVVLGSADEIALRDTDALRFAAATVDRTRGVPADKLLADELEVVHVLRTLMEYRAENVRDTMRHIATVAATALSCEVALIRVDRAGGPVFEAISFDAARSTVDARVESWLEHASAMATPAVEQAAGADSWPFDAAVASHLRLPLGSDPRIGALALGHSVSRPRGFTALCQRIGRAVADAAELLITQAASREALADERDLLARISGTDALTGVANRRAWDEAAAAFAIAQDRTQAHVITADLDGLKQANDAFGHSAGDALIRGASNLLSSSVREDDLVARIGGDEFAILLRGADHSAARRVLGRIRRAERRWRVTEHDLIPRMSLGLAPVVDGDIEAARVLADERMYASKRRRLRRSGSVGRPKLPDRRRQASV